MKIEDRIDRLEKLVSEIGCRVDVHDFRPAGSLRIPNAPTTLLIRCKHCLFTRAATIEEWETAHDNAG